MARNDPVSMFASEFRLALACSRWPQRDSDRAEICSFAGELLNWEWFTKIVERNQIVPMVYRNLRDALGGECQLDVLKSLREAALCDAAHSLSQAAELARIVALLGSFGVESVALKGVALSLSVYGNSTVRSSGDIDLLISASDIFEVEGILATIGYTRYDPRATLTPKRFEHFSKYHKHFTYCSPARASTVELHWRLFDSIEFFEEGKVPSTVPVVLGSGVVRTLPRNELFLYLCAHGAIHGWPILKWLADVGAMLRTLTADDLSYIGRLASERGLVDELSAALRLVDDLLAVERPGAELPVNRNPAVERIVGMAKRLLTAQDYCLDLHQPPRFATLLYGLRLRSSARHRREGLKRALFYPGDWYMLPLPDVLFPLYALVRPIGWLFRHLLRVRKRPHLRENSPRHLPS
jgi:hypothetical protein